MPENESRKYVQVVDYIEDQVGADVPRDAIKTVIQEVDDPAASEGMQVDLAQIGNTALTGADLMKILNSVGGDEVVSRIANSSGGQIDPATTALENALKANDADEFISRVANSGGTEIDPATTALEDALKSNDADEFVSRVAGSDGVEVQEVALDTVANATDVALLSYVARALNDIGQDELVSRLVDSTGTQIDPSRKTDFPNTQLTGQDVTAGDVTVGPVAVERSEAVVIAVNETSGGSVNVSVDWEDGSGNVFQTESDTDIGLSAVTEDWARLVRKGPQVEVTVSNDSSATSTNIHVDTER